MRPLAGIAVTVTGGAITRQAITGSDGVYEIYGLPPGAYRVDPVLPMGLTIEMRLPGRTSLMEEPHELLAFGPDEGARYDFVIKRGR